MRLKNLFVLLAIAFLAGVVVGFVEFPRMQTQSNENAVVSGVCFSPNGGCEDQVISWINKANASIHVLIYSFSLDSIGDALIGVHGRNSSIDIGIVFEKSQIQSSSQYQRLKNNGINVRNDTNPYDMHEKVMIVDGKIVLTGSFNWSNAGEEHNDENLIVITSSSIASIYESEFQKIWNSATS